MSLSFYKISIPQELKSFAKDGFNDDGKIFVNDTSSIVQKRNEKGFIEYIDLFSESGMVEQRIVYKGCQISKIYYYRNNYRYRRDEFYNENICKTDYFDRNGCLTETVEYCYSKDNKICAIKKRQNNNEYLIKYNYDELFRINQRQIYINSTLIWEQKYKFDILDRISEYRDNHQQIIVNKIGTKNELISYTITDTNRNTLHIENKFENEQYVNTTVTLNTHFTVVKNKEYVDNILLKKPTTAEFDLNFILSLLVSKPSYSPVTRRHNLDDILGQNCIDTINNNIKPNVVPLSMRKRMLIEKIQAGIK